MRSTQTSVALALIVTAFAGVWLAHAQPTQTQMTQAQQTQVPHAIIESFIKYFRLFETWREPAGATFAFPSRTVRVNELVQPGN